MKSSQQEKIAHLKFKLGKYELWRYMVKFSQNRKKGSANMRNSCPNSSDFLQFFCRHSLLPGQDHRISAATEQ